MEKNISKNFENQNLTQENNFDNIKISMIEVSELILFLSKFIVGF